MEIGIEYIIAAFTALTGAIAYLYRMQVNLRRCEAEHRATFIAKLEGKIAFLEATVASLQDEVATLKAEKATLQAQFIAYTSSHESAPLPMWIKDVEGRIITCNSSYEQEFLLPMGKAMSDYIGHRDTAIWPDHVAEEYIKNDLHVLRTRQTLDTFETVPSRIDPKRQLRIIKWPRYAVGIDQPFGIAGIAILAKPE